MHLRRVTWSASGQSQSVQSQGSPERSHPPPLSEHSRALLAHAASGHHRVSPLVSFPSPNFGAPHAHSRPHSPSGRSHTGRSHFDSQPQSQAHSLFGSSTGASAIFTPALSRSLLAARLAVDPVSVAPPTDLCTFPAFGPLEERRPALGVLHSGSASASASGSGSSSRSPSQSEAGSPPSVCQIAGLASPGRTSPVTPREVAFANLNLAIPSSSSGGVGGGERSQSERQVSYMSRRSTDFSVRSSEFPVRQRRCVHTHSHIPTYML